MWRLKIRSKWRPDAHALRIFLYSIYGDMVMRPRVLVVLL